MDQADALIWRAGLESFHRPIAAPTVVTAAVGVFYCILKDTISIAQLKCCAVRLAGDSQMTPLPA